MDKYKINKNIPMPKPSQLSALLPWDEMDVGDSFFVPVEDVQSNNSIRQTVYASNRRRKPKFFRVVFDDSGVDFGYRVFRVK